MLELDARLRMSKNSPLWNSVITISTILAFKCPSPFSEEKGRGELGEELCKGGTGRREAVNIETDIGM